jgi:DNA-binding MarR family transcriptional regulator
MKHSVELLELVWCLGRLLSGELRSRGNATQLQPVHLQALLYLAQANRYSNTPQALTEYLGLTKGTVSQSLLLLYRRGLIERFTDAKDRRVVRLKLAERGEELLRQLSSEAQWDQALAPLAEETVTVAVDVLRSVLLNLQRIRGGRSFGVCRTCRHFRQETEGRFRCGLTGEPLSLADSSRICREHEWPNPASAL